MEFEMGISRKLSNLFLMVYFVLLILLLSQNAVASESKLKVKT